MWSGLPCLPAWKGSCVNSHSSEQSPPHYSSLPADMMLNFTPRKSRLQWPIPREDPAGIVEEVADAAAGYPPLERDLNPSPRQRNLHQPSWFPRFLQPPPQQLKRPQPRLQGRATIDDIADLIDRLNGLLPLPPRHQLQSRPLRLQQLAMPHKRLRQNRMVPPDIDEER